MVWMSGGRRAIVTVEVDREISEKPHWQFVDFPSEFHRYVEHQQAIDSGLILRERGAVRQMGITALEVDVKCVAVARVIVNRRRELEVECLREIQLRSQLPRQQESIRVRD